MSTGAPAGKKLLSERVYLVEQRFVALAISIMGIVVFFDVLHRVTSRDLTWGWRAVWAVLALFGVLGALRLRGHAPGVKTWGLSAAVVGLLYAGVLLFHALMPNGLVWSQTLGLVLMLWVGVIGASMATREHRHLALDLGSKLWPKKMLPAVQGVGNVVTSLFCLALAVLACVSVRDHLRDWSDTDGAGGVFPALPIPKWLAFSGVPVGFTLMAVRFFAQALESFRGKVEEDDAMHMLGLKDEEPKS